MSNPATAIIGFGADLASSVDAGVTYLSVAQVVDLGPPGIKCSDVDKTHLKSSNNMREFMAGLGDAGEIEFKLLFEKVEVARIYPMFRTTLLWKLTFSDVGVTGSTWVCSGYINDIGGTNPMDDKVTLDCKIKLTGKPLFTAGT